MPTGAPRIAWYDYLLSLTGCSGEGCAPVERPPAVNTTCRVANATPPQCGAGNVTDIFPRAQLALLARAYAAAISHVDFEIGRLLRTLEVEGVANNTIVLVVGDHGQNLGEHNLFSKMTLYETSLRAPMILRVPCGPHGCNPPRNEGQVVEFLDIYPTLAALALHSLPPPPDLDGRDLSPLVRNSSQDHRHAASAPAPVRLDREPEPPSPNESAAFSQITRCWKSYENALGPCSAEFGLKSATEFDFMGMSVRVAGWRYTEWRVWNGTALAPDWSAPLVASELYAHSVDDGSFVGFVNGESVNVASDPANAQTVEVLRDRLRLVFG